MEIRPTIRFGVFEADPVAGELRKAGRLVRLQDQPFRLLLILLERPGEVVTRDQIREKLWGATSVEFEEGLNTAVRKLREALDDSATNPHFIETLPRRGYRFVAAVVVPPPDTDPAAPPESAATSGHRRRTRWPLLAGSGFAILVAAVLMNRGRPQARPSQLSPSPLVQLTRDTGLTTDPAISRDGKLLAYASDKGGKENLDIWMQHIPEGEAHQLTDDTADDSQPDISPDGTEVVFRSEREGGGIYSVSTLGGAPRLITKNAYLPRYSPDSSQIAWLTGAYGTGAFSGALHVLTIATGVIRDLAPNIFVAGPATWSPDGRSLVFVGSPDVHNDLFLWTCQVNGSAAVKISPRQITDESRLAPGIERTISVAWFGNRIIVAARNGDSSNLWTGSLSPRSGQLTGDLTRLTLGSGTETLPSVSANGSLVFANHIHTMDIWEASLKKDGPMRRLTNAGGLNYGPSVMADGSRLTFISDRTGRPEVWLKDLGSGKDRVLTRTGYRETAASISRDGTRFAVWDDAGGISVGNIAGGPLRRVCSRCGRPDDWFPDGKILVWHGSDSIDRLDPETGSVVSLIQNAPQEPVAPNLSPDGKWIVFHSPDPRNFVRQIFIAPYTGRLVPRSEWIEVTDGTALDREAKWAASGNLIYFLSDRDGYRCIWGLNVDPKTKQPLGAIDPVLHLHHPRVTPLHVSNTGSVKINAVGDKLIFTMGELTGNLWLTELR